MSLIHVGKLAYASKVVIAGRLFFRWMIDTAYLVRHLHHWVNLNANFRYDLEWWYAFLEKWNGRSMMEVHDPNWNPDIINFFSLMCQVPGVVGQCGRIYGSSVLGIMYGVRKA